MRVLEGRVDRLESDERRQDSFLSGSRAIVSLVLVLVSIFGVVVANLVLTDKHAGEAPVTITNHARETDVLTTPTVTIGVATITVTRPPG
jgi:hypothetical protein